MRVTTKGQVTILCHIREKLGIRPNSNVSFLEEDGRVYLPRKKVALPKENKFRRYRGIATVKMTNGEIMALTRGCK